MSVPAQHHVVAILAKGTRPRVHAHAQPACIATALRFGPSALLRSSFGLHLPLGDPGGQRLALRGLLRRLGRRLQRAHLGFELVLRCRCAVLSTGRDADSGPPGQEPRVLARMIAFSYDAIIASNFWGIDSNGINHRSQPA
jgi:hypothetical protein